MIIAFALIVAQQAAGTGAVPDLDGHQRCGSITRLDFDWFDYVAPA